MSSSSSSSPGSSSSPAPTKKKRQVEVEAETPESSEGHDTPEASSADEEANAPRSLPQAACVVLSHAERRRQRKRQQRDQLATASPRKKRKLDDGTGAPPPSNVDPDSDPDSDAKVNAKATSKPESNAESAAVALEAKATSASDNHRRHKRQNSVWVGNLSFRTTQDALRVFFDGVGKITRVHMPMRRGMQTQGENMGFAYVDFETPEAKVIAITLSESQLEGRNLLIKDGEDFTTRPAEAAPPEGAGVGEGETPAKNATRADGSRLSNGARMILRAQKQPPAPTLFLGNLGFETTEESIRELLEAHRRGRHGGKGKGNAVHGKSGGRDCGAGEDQDGMATLKDVWIRKIRMGTFEDSGVCKGFAFVDFTSIEHATEALVNPRNHRLNGRNLVVEYASPDAVRRGGGGLRRSKQDGDRQNRNTQKGSATVPYTKQRRLPRRIERGEEDPDVVETPRAERPERARPDRPYARRAKPGAALALAQRQSAAILPSQGEKIVF